MWHQISVISSLLISVFFLNIVSEKAPFINLEHPRVAYANKNFLKYINVTATRYGRNNPIYYIGMHFEPLVPVDQNVIIDIYFYELLTNVYKISFIHLHQNWCDLLNKDVYFGAAVRRGGLKTPCPHPPGQYHLFNMTSPINIPRGFPFSNGRIYGNFSQAKTNIRILELYIDMKLINIDLKYITN